VKLFPGVRLNLSKSGVSTSIGGKGGTINIGPKGTTATVGIPGTGLSYRTSTLHNARANSPVAHHFASTSLHSVEQSLVTGSGPVDGFFKSEPSETAYRIAALLASALLAGASTDEVEARIAGLLPANLPGRITSAIYARTLITMALGRDGTSYQGTAAVRRALTKAGMQHIEMVTDAVAAVRASMKARANQVYDATLPLEWYREDGKLLQREYEAPSLRVRVPAATLNETHAQQVELGKQRMQTDLTYKAPPILADAPLWVRLIAYLVLAAAGAGIGIVITIVIVALSKQ
jgi:hypothetical protein